MQKSKSSDKMGFFFIFLSILFLFYCSSMALGFHTVTLILSENNMLVQSHVMSYFNIQILKVDSWSFEDIISLLIYFLNCRKALFIKK